MVENIRSGGIRRMPSNDRLRLSFDKYGRVEIVSGSEAGVLNGVDAVLRGTNYEKSDGSIAAAVGEFNKKLEITILPTEKCDFDCVYCFEEFKLGLMQQPVVDGVKNLISTRISDLSSLNIMWYGGEPMLAYPIIVNIMEHIATIRPGGVDLYSEMTTNGYNLTGEKFSRLVDLGVKNYQITFDGDRNEHNKLRTRKNRKLTFDVIFDNVTLQHHTDLDFNIKVRMHVNQGNQDSMRGLLRRFKLVVGRDPRYEFNLRGLINLNGREEMDSLVMPQNSNVVQELIDMARDMGLKTSFRDPEYVCYASKPNSYIVRPNGGLLKCGVHLYNQSNTIGHLNSDGSIEINSALAEQWSRGLLSGNRLELSCPAINLINKH